MRSFKIFFCCIPLLASSLMPWPTPASSGQPQVVQHAGSLRELFPTPSQGMVIRKAEEMSMREMLDEFMRVTGEHLILSEQIATDLADSTTQLARDMVLKPEDVYTEVQTLLLHNDYVLLDGGRSPARILHVSSLQGEGTETVIERARYVPEEELEHYAQARALVLTTVIDVPHLDLKDLPEAMQYFMDSSQYIQIIPLPSCGQVVVTAYGQRAYDLRQMLVKMNAGAAGVSGKRAKAVNAK